MLPDNTDSDDLFPDMPLRPKTPMPANSDPESILPEEIDDESLFPSSSGGLTGTDDEEVDFGRLQTADEGASAAVPLSQLSGPLSGASIVSWADLMKLRAAEENRFDLDDVDVKFDAASDRDLLREANDASSRLNLTEPLPGLAGDSDDFLTAEFASRPRDTGSSVNLLGDHGSVHGEDDSDIFSNVRPPTPISDDVFDFPEPVGLSSSDGSSRPKTLPDVDGDDAMFTIEPSAPSPDNSSIMAGHHAPDSNLWGGSSRVNLLGSLPEIDLGREAMDDTHRVDPPELPRPSAIQSAINRSRDYKNDPSSAVELGTNSVVDLPYPLGMDSNVASGVVKRGGKPASDPDSGKVDLLNATVDPKGSGVGLSKIVKEMAAAKREQAGSPSRVVQKPAPRRMSALTGGLMGSLLGGGAVAAVGVAAWFAGVVPTPAGRVGTKATTPVTVSQAALERGAPAEALAALQPAASSPEVLAARGQARLLSHLQQCQRDGQPVRTDDPAIVEARKELSDAGTASAALWLGLLEESLKRPEAARQVYSDAANRFQAERRVFQAALDRIDSQQRPRTTTSQRPAEVDAATVGVAVVTLMLQLEPPTPAQPDEPGYKFWESLKLAQKHSYAAAKAALLDARKAHDERRRLQPKPGTNPLSDPLEEIFVRSCDEIVAYWNLREKLQGGGYNPANFSSPEAAVQKLLDDRRGTRAALDAVAKSLTDAKLDGKNPTVAVATLVKDRTADKAAIAKLTTEGKTASDKLTAAQAKVTELTAAKSAADKALAAANAKAKQLDDDLVAERAKLVEAMANTPDPKPLAEARTQIVKLQLELKAARDAMASAPPATAEVAKLRDQAAKLEAELKVANDKLAAVPSEATVVALRMNVAKLEAESKSARAEAIVARDQVEKVTENARTAVTQLAQRDRELRKATDALAMAKSQTATLQSQLDETAAKLAAAPTAEAVAKSAAERDAALRRAAEFAGKLRGVEQTVGELMPFVAGVRERLLAAKWVGPDASPAELVAGLERGLANPGTDRPVPPSADAVRVRLKAKADALFADGLRRYFAGDAAGAETQFAAAARELEGDARYHFFLGLSKQRQGKDGRADFARGAALEQQGLPPAGETDRLLERVQGEGRRALDGVR